MNLFILLTLSIKILKFYFFAWNPVEWRGAQFEQGNEGEEGNERPTLALFAAAAIGLDAATAIGFGADGDVEQGQEELEWFHGTADTH